APPVRICNAGECRAAHANTTNSRESTIPFNRHVARTPPMGYFSSGVGLGPLGNAHEPSVILSNGLDSSPQPLVVRSLDTRQRPRWYSGDLDYHGRVSLGDVDADGINDAAVAVLFGQDLAFQEGGFKVYRGEGSAFTKQPVQRVSKAATLAMGLGDLDGDGDLDLALGVMAENGQFAAWPPPQPGPVRIYGNERGKFSENPIWQSEEKSYVGAVTLADINLDGLMDIVAAGDRLRVYFGKPREGGGSLPPYQANWRSRESWQVGYALSVTTLGSLKRRGVVVSPTCVGGNDCKAQPIFAYVPEVTAQESNAVWQSGIQGVGGGLATADFNNDGVPDLVGGQIFNTAAMEAHPLYFFPGTADGFTTNPTLATETLFVASDVTTGLGAEPQRGVNATESFQSEIGASVVTVQHPIWAVHAASINGQRLPLDAFAYAIGSDAVSLRSGTNIGTVTVSYQWIPNPDVVVAEGRPAWGSGVLPNLAAGLR
ncbi:MAG TPA: FG-GAP-like repeat-containing protein, partial [Polyangiaceae bacterium]|nr:FG-GAP-like repeat-containing protein [Polyangiaceae bacterium]